MAVMTADTLQGRASEHQGHGTRPVLVSIVADPGLWSASLIHTLAESSTADMSTGMTTVSA